MRAAIALVSALVLAACNMAEAQRSDGEAARSTGTAGQRDFQAAGFDSVSLGGHHNVVIAVGAAHSVRAEGDERELQDLEITTRGNELHIGLTEEARRRGHHDRTPVTVYVTLPALAKAAIGGSGDMRIDNVQGGSFEAAIGGSGDIEIASLRVETARFSIAGSGDIRAAAGQAQSTDVSIAGSGNVDLGAVESRNTDVSVVGSGDVQVRASEAASVSVMGSGDVTVAGQARCRVSKMGSGDVRCEA
jgi:hypothetical protein